jgi:hypothetical protein
VPEPVVEKPDIPPEHGNPTQHLDWTDVERRLESATVYWIASTRRDGRPHGIPGDGMWLDGGLHYGGSPETVHYRNITTLTPWHIVDGQEAIIVEGAVEIEKPTAEMAARLSDESFRMSRSASIRSKAVSSRASTWEVCRSYGRAASRGPASSRTLRASGSSSERSPILFPRAAIRVTPSLQTLGSGWHPLRPDRISMLRGVPLDEPAASCVLTPCDPSSVRSDVLADGEIVDAIQPELGILELLLGRGATNHFARGQLEYRLQSQLGLAEPLCQLDRILVRCHVRAMPVT